MNKAQFIELLNDDLKNEYTHMLFYLHYAAMVEGLHRFEVREFLLEEAKSEMLHVDEFAHVITGLGGQPIPASKEFPADMTCPYDILSYAIHMEREVVANYAARMKQTDELHGSLAWEDVDSDAAYVHVFMEDNVKDSRKTVDELLKVIKHAD